MSEIIQNFVQIPNSDLKFYELIEYLNKMTEKEFLKKVSFIDRLRSRHIANVCAACVEANTYLAL